MTFRIQSVPTVPFEGQKPGTSGLRKPVKTFQQDKYTENFVQCILDSFGQKLIDSVLVVGGDGRYFCKTATEMIIKICAANGVAKLIVGKNGILSTPAVSALIRKNNTLGGILLTASHNPGGPDHDFGIKFNLANGGPAPESNTNAVYKLSTAIKSYKIVPDLHCDVGTIGRSEYNVEDKKFVVDVIDSVACYTNLMKEIFDFPALKSLLRGDADNAPVKILINCLNGVTGPYVQRIFVEELGAPLSSVVNIVPLEDFGGKHPDPNLTYAAELVTAMENGDFDFGAAFDGDGDRNMILGRKGFFVNPSDSLAVLADNVESIPYFARTKVKGFSRSMPTGCAVDRVAIKKGIDIYEVPTGWKFFGNLMDANKLSLCGEESFGTGSDHIREKDGIWASLAWLSVIKHCRMSVQDIMKQHWTKYGRNFFTRYDYENCDASVCNAWFSELETLVTSQRFIGTPFDSLGKRYSVLHGDNFSYKDPIDGSVSNNQGLRILLNDGNRIIFRLSGTGSSGATVRMYVEAYEDNVNTIFLDAKVVLQPLISVALKMSKLTETLGRQEPTVIT